MSESSDVRHWVQIRTSDPSAIGEHLRGLFFDQSDGDTGCYSTFDYNPTQQIECRPKEPILYEGGGFYGEHWTVAHYDGPDEQFIGTKMRYHWDGDGTLQFILPSGGVIENPDCKKNYVWEWKARA